MFEQATKLLPTFVEAYTYWGNALQEMGQMALSAKVFQDAIAKFVKGKGKGEPRVVCCPLLPACLLCL